MRNAMLFTFLLSTSLNASELDREAKIKLEAQSIFAIECSLEDQECYGSEIKETIINKDKNEVIFITNKGKFNFSLPKEL